MPLATPTLAPPPGTAVQLMPVRASGSVSATVASSTSAGPALVTTIVYVTTVPGLTSVSPSVLVICRSASVGDGSTIGVLSMAVLLPGTGSSPLPPSSAIRTVLSICPVVPSLTVTANTAVPVSPTATSPITNTYSLPPTKSQSPTELIASKVVFGGRVSYNVTCRASCDPMLP